MVTKTDKNTEQKGRVKVGKLKVNKESIKDLTSGEAKKVKGGLAQQVKTCWHCGQSPSRDGVADE